MTDGSALSAQASMQGELWGQHPGAGQGSWNLRRAHFSKPPWMHWTRWRVCGSSTWGAARRQALVIAEVRGALVSGLDASKPLLDVARSRLPEADLRVGDLETLPYDSGTFDRVTAFNAIQYAAAPSVAMGELARVCCPGGRAAVGDWGDSTRCETEVLFARLCSLATPPPGTAAPLAVREPGVVESLMEDVGLKPSDGGEVPLPIRFADLDEASVANSSAGPVRKLIDMVGSDKVRAVVTYVLEADRKSDGELRQHNVMRHIVANRPQ